MNPDLESRSRKWTRRQLLTAASGAVGASWLGVVLTQSGCSPSGARCFDPEALSAGEHSLRASQAYVDRSTTESPDGGLLSCSDCEFFQAAPSGPECGECRILSGPVSAAGHCNAWAARQTQPS